MDKEKYTDGSLFCSKEEWNYNVFRGKKQNWRSLWEVKCFAHMLKLHLNLYRPNVLFGHHTSFICLLIDKLINLCMCVFLCEGGCMHRWLAARAGPCLLHCVRGFCLPVHTPGQLAWASGSFPPPPHLTGGVLGLQICKHDCVQFYWSPGDPNSSFHDCVASALSSKPFLQSSVDPNTVSLSSLGSSHIHEIFLRKK